MIAIRPVAAIALTLLLLIPARPAQAAPPAAQISIQSTSGMAPFTVHVHAMNSAPGVGSALTARYEWFFGDPAGDYNELEGFNAAHVYDTPGVYQLTLRVTSEVGEVSERSVTVQVAPDTRQRIHVSPTGNDANNGSSGGQAVRTLDRAFALLDDDTAILLKRGGSWNLVSGYGVPYHNVVIGAYGGGSAPTLHWTGSSSTFSSILSTASESAAVIIEGLRFDSAHAAGNDIVRGVATRGYNITVRNCHFDDVSTAVMAESGGAHGLLTLGNTTEVIGAYYCWGEGTDQTHLGNVVAGSIDQHNLRINAQRVLIADCDLTNTYKSCVWFQSGSWGYLAGNVLREGPAQVGPIPQVGDAGARWRWAVIEANELFHDSYKILHGAEHVMLRSNVSSGNNVAAFEVMGWDTTMQRTAVDVRIVNNTAVNYGTNGKFLQAGAGTSSLAVANNLFFAPNLAPGASGTANVYVADSSLAGFSQVAHNLWSEAAQGGSGTGVHYVWPSWWNPSGYKSAQQWSQFGQTLGETYRDYGAQDLAADYAPQFDAITGEAVRGVHTDFYGDARPLQGEVAVGAVEMAAAPPPPPPPPPGGGSTPSDGPGSGGDGTPGDGGDDGGGTPGPGDDDPPSTFEQFIDDFELDLGWTVEHMGVTGGGWERGTPTPFNAPGAPAADADGSGRCWLTGSSGGDSDVDGGPTRLISPALDATGAANATVRYAAWFTTDGPGEDHFTVKISNDGGASWVFVERIPPLSQWQQRSFRVADYVEPTDQIHVRFGVIDLPAESRVEGALDDFQLIDDPNLPMARFIDLDEQYHLGSGHDVHLQILPAAPAAPKVVFQVWSHENSAIVAAQSDDLAPFVYEAEMLDQVPAGLTTVQAIVRNQSYQPLQIISRQVLFTDELTLAGDLNGDGVLSISDMLLIFQSWGACPALPASCPADLNGDGVVDGGDLQVFADLWN